MANLEEKLNEIDIIIKNNKVRTVDEEIADRERLKKLCWEVAVETAQKKESREIYSSAMMRLRVLQNGFAIKDIPLLDEMHGFARKNPDRSFAKNFTIFVGRNRELTPENRIKDFRSLKEFANRIEHEDKDRILGLIDEGIARQIGTDELPAGHNLAEDKREEEARKEHNINRWTILRDWVGSDRAGIPENEKAGMLRVLNEAIENGKEPGVKADRDILEKVTLGPADKSYQGYYAWAKANNEKDLPQFVFPVKYMEAGRKYLLGRPAKRGTYKTLGGDIFISLDDKVIPREIMNTSNIQEIADFLTVYADELDKIDPLYSEYLNKQVQSVLRIDSLANKLAANQEKPPLAEVKQNKNGLSLNITQKELQTSGNGCWSVAYANLLQSRGVDVSQQDIRAYRQVKDPDDAGKLSDNETKILCQDEKANPFEKRDILHTLLPDTAMREVALSRNMDISEKDQVEITTQFLKQYIRDSIEIHHSPVALLIDGHYRTIVGFEGERVLYKDSLPHEDSRTGSPDETYDDYTFYQIARLSLDPEKPVILNSLVDIDKLEPVKGRADEEKSNPESRIVIGINSGLPGIDIKLSYSKQRQINLLPQEPEEAPAKEEQAQKEEAQAGEEPVQKEEAPAKEEQAQKEEEQVKEEQVQENDPLQVEAAAKEQAKPAGTDRKKLIERNSALNAIPKRFSDEDKRVIKQIEREAILNNRPVPPLLRALTDAMSLFEARPNVEKLLSAYQNVIDKADAYLESIKNDPAFKETGKWAGDVRKNADSAYKDLKTRIDNNEFTKEEMRLPATYRYFPEKTETFDKDEKVRRSEDGLDKLEIPYDNRLPSLPAEQVNYADKAAQDLIKQCDKLPTLEQKLELLADLYAADHMKIMRPGYDSTVTLALENHILFDENGKLRPEAQNFQEKAASVIIKWRLEALNKLRESGNKDAKWGLEIQRADALSDQLTMGGFAFRHGYDGEEFYQIMKDKQKKVSKEDVDDMAKFDLTTIADISDERSFALKYAYIDKLSDMYPDILINREYISSLNHLQNELNNAANASGSFNKNEELKGISEGLGVLAEIADMRNSDEYSETVNNYAENLSYRTLRFMEREALQTKWHEKDNAVRDKLLDTLRFSSPDLEKRYLEKEAGLRKRAEDLAFGRSRLNDFFDSQSSRSKDTLKNLVSAASMDDSKKAVKAMGEILEKRYGLGKEFSAELAQSLKAEIDNAQNRGEYPVNSWRSTADMLKEGLKNIPDLKLNDFRISKKGSKVSAEYIPGLNAQKIGALRSAGRGIDGSNAVFTMLDNMTADAAAFDNCLEMFETKKSYRLLNRNSEEYDEAKEALEKYVEERNKLAAMGEKYNGRELSKEEEAEVSQQIENSADAMRNCVISLDNYIIKEGGNAQDKSQDAGFARLAGAEGLMEIFLRSGGKEFKSDLSRTMEIINKDRVKVKAFSELYEEEFKKAAKEGTKDRHRKAAANARKTMNKPVEKTEKPEMAMGNLGM